MAELSLAEIAQKYELVNSKGLPAILHLANAVRRLREKNRALFAVMDEQEKAVMRHEYLSYVREGVTMGRETRAAAIAKGELSTALAAEDNILKAAAKLGDVIDVTGTKTPVQQPGTVNNTTYNLLALPKLAGVPTRPPQVIEMQKKLGS